MTNLPVHEGADFDTVVEDVHLGAWLVFHVGGLQHLIAINRGISKSIRHFIRHIMHHSVILCVTRPLWILISLIIKT